MPKNRFNKPDHAQRFVRAPVAAAVSAALLIPATGIAQETVEDRLEEVVVTASRRESGIQDLPFNISALGGEQLEALSITDFDALSKSMPGLAFNDPSPWAAMTDAWVIRGLNNEGVHINMTPPSQQPTVTTYIDDTPLYVNLRFKDLARVEALRGPQGTLYGSGSMGGAIRFISNRPDLDQFSSKVSAGVSQTADSDDMNYEADVIFNIPLSETFGARVYAGVEEMAGYLDATGLYVLDDDGSPVLADPANPIDSVALFQPTKKDVNGYSTQSARLSLRWQPSDSVDTNLTYHYQKQEADGRNLNAFLRGGLDGRESASLIEEPFESTTDLLSLEVEADLGFATLTSSTSVYDTTAEGTSEYLFLYLNFGFYETFYGASPRPLHTVNGANNNEGFVQEIRLVSNYDEGPIDWIVGGFYLDQDISLRAQHFYKGYQDYFNACAPVNGIWFTTGNTVCGLGTISGDRNGILVTDETPYMSNATTNYKDLSFFGEVTWHVTEKLQLTGGLRAFRQDYTTLGQAGLLWTPTPPVNRSADGDEDDVLFKLNASYQMDGGTLLYATVSEGFRRGGVNALPVAITGIPTNPELFEYDSDKILNTEIGIKGTINDRFRYSLSLYDIDWEKMQIDTIATRLAIQTVENIGDVSSRGVELELNGNVSENLYMGFGYGYVDTEVKNHDVLPAGIQNVPPIGAPLPGVPAHTANINAQYSLALQRGGRVDFVVSGAYRDETTGKDAGAFDGDRNGEALTTWDASATWQVNDSWSVRGYVKNLFDEQANLAFVREDFVRSNFSPFFGIPASPPSDRLTPFSDRVWSRITAPRVLGMVVKYEFGE